MPRFFIDTDDGDRLDRDEDGYDLVDRAAARIEAIGALPDLARSQIPDGDRRTSRCGSATGPARRSTRRP